MATEKTLEQIMLEAELADLLRFGMQPGDHPDREGEIRAELRDLDCCCEAATESSALTLKNRMLRLRSLRVPK